MLLCVKIVWLRLHWWKISTGEISTKRFILFFYFIMEIVVNNGKITSAEIQEMFKITRQAAHKEIKKMSDLGVIELKGESKAAYYVAKAG